MRWLALLALVAGPAQAMEPADCARLQALVGEAVPPVAELKLAPRVTTDGWCRVLAGPFGEGIEWQGTADADGFFAEFRQNTLTVAPFGAFTMTAQVAQRPGTGLSVGPIRLIRPNGDAAVLTLALGPLDLSDAAAAQQSLGGVTLTSGALSVQGRRGLVADVLAWAFRLDARAARSNLTVARDQRTVMLDWLDGLPDETGDAAGRAAFRDLVAAYPGARGTATLSVPAGNDVALGTVIGAVLFGSDLSRGASADLVRKAGLTLTWQPD